MQVRIISLDPEDTMKVLGVQAVQSTPESLLLLDSPLVGASGTEEGRGVGALFLHVGEQLCLLIHTPDRPAPWSPKCSMMCCAAGPLHLYCVTLRQHTVLPVHNKA